MTEPTLFKDYVHQIEAAYKAGNATEHTHRPALKTLLEAVQPDIIATNEPRRIKCGAPDFILTRQNIPLGFIEAKDIGLSLDEAEKSEQLLRYRESLSNLILTDYLEFHWYVCGKLRLSTRLAKIQADGRLRVEADGIQQLSELLNSFFTANIPTVANSKELAVRMAALARLMRTIIAKTFAEEETQGALHEQLNGFREVLLHDLSVEQFADMYAQTICYGLFAARCNTTNTHFSRIHAAYDLPRTNPFLRKLFDHIAGPHLDERIVWAVDDLAELLNRTDIAAVLADFGRSTLQEDPVVHFYETFLAAYDPKMREARGVYYTPEPVVSYIVRSVDAILKNDFELPQGLADSTKIKLTRPKDHGKGTETFETHQVQILDPATGTGTFLHHVISHIHQTFSGNKGLWTGYVRDNLLPRVYGFELLMAPYAVAHMKLGLLLRQTGYDFSSDERLRVFLTNTLEEAHELSGLPLFTQWLAAEANSANQIKNKAPVMVVMGNPPYSGHSANVGKWIAKLLHGVDSSTGKMSGNYFEVDGESLGERNPKWLNDDYVKFMRFAQWRIEQTGYGVLAFITNNGYLDNPTFRGMRQSLMQSFDDIYLLDLHGNSKKKETAPDGSKDENVFDIMQGVSIGIFVKRNKAQTKTAQVHHAEIYGTRARKSRVLLDSEIRTTRWKKLKPKAPFYLFVPQNEKLRAEYEASWKITEVMPLNVLGFQTHRDNFAVDFEYKKLYQRIGDMRFTELDDAAFLRKYDLNENRDWKISAARKQLRADADWKDKFMQCAYRPFDTRWTYFSEVAADYPRRELKSHVFDKENLCLNIMRQTKSRLWRHAAVSDKPTPAVYVEVKDGSTVCPLYLYTTSDLLDEDNGDPSRLTKQSRRANLAPEFIKEFSASLKRTFVPDGCGDLKKTFGPEDVFHYAYAVFHSPAYRNKYAEFLKIDFPRLPLTSDAKLFRKLCEYGKELVHLHLLKTLPKPSTCYPIEGDNRVENVRYAEATKKEKGRVWINKTQYFENVPPEVWTYHVGGYQVCQKWLKDRKDRLLTYDDLTQYQGIVSALSRTIEVQTEIDAAIGEWPIVGSVHP